MSSRTLPPELLLPIIAHLAAARAKSTLVQLQRVSRQLYILTTPALYHSVRLGSGPGRGLFKVFDLLALAELRIAACPVDEVEAALRDRHPIDVPRAHRIRWALTLVKRLEVDTRLQWRADSRVQALSVFVDTPLLPSVRLLVESPSMVDRDSLVLRIIPTCAEGLVRSIRLARDADVLPDLRPAVTSISDDSSPWVKLMTDGGDGLPEHAHEYDVGDDQ
ncbi:hypothetical protein Q5752_002960 [Cryptotrichosporon argae]